MSSRGISGDFRNPTALVRVFSDSRGNLKKLPSRGIFMSRSRGIFTSPSRGISGDVRNPTALVRVFSSSRGNLKRLPPRGIFHISPLELSWQQKPIFPPEGFFTFILWSSHGALMASADIPSRGIFYTSLWRFKCISQLTLW